MKRSRRGTWTAFWITVSIFGQVVASRNVLAVSKTGVKGDPCTIDLPDGLKEPGTDDGNGHCCSVLHEGKCVDIPKPNPASKGTLAAGTTKKTTAVIQTAPTPTPTPSKRTTVGGAKSAAPTPSPTPK